MKAWYTGDPVYDTILAGALALIPLTVAGLFFMETPYGRFGGKGKGLHVSPRLGWFLMELPAPLTFLFFYFRGGHPYAPISLAFLGLWCLHYAYRTFTFPALMRVAPGYHSTFSFFVVASGWLVTPLHGYLSAGFVSGLGRHLDASWFTDARFLAGLFVYLVGFGIILHSDSVLRQLRPKDPAKAAGLPRYQIPRGGLFRFVTNAQFLGELTAWTGFALATWSLPGVFILGISAANLIPRAMANHRWYRSAFPDYPRERKVLIPFVF